MLWSAQLCYGLQTFHNVALKDLKVLRLSVEQQSTLEAIPLRSRRTFSYYESSDGYVYHLHLEFITSASENDILVEQATLCGKCKQNCADDQTIPKFSIAAGVDFGDPKRVHLPELSLIKQCVIYRGIAFVVIVKLLGI